MKISRWLGMLAAGLTVLCSCAPSGRGLPPLQTVAKVDVQRYLGTWYEIASFPHRFQKGCVATSAVYSLRDDGQLEVVNECHQETLTGPLKSVHGRARVVDPVTSARLEVTFFWPFWGDYWVIDLDPDYRWVVVGHPSRNYLWILSRTRTLDESLYERIVARLPAQGYDPVRLQRTLQPID